VIVASVERFQCAELYFTPTLLLTDSKIVNIEQQQQGLSSAAVASAPFKMNDNKTLLNGGIHHLICESIAKCDGDIRSELYGNIVLSGCSSQLPGFATRLSQELNQLIRASASANANGAPPMASPLSSPSTTPSTVNDNGEIKSSQVRIISSCDNDEFTACNGAASLTSLPSMASLWITKQEYEEFGSTIVHRRCI
jgi:actin